MSHELTKSMRVKLGRNANSSASIVDSQSAKTTQKGDIRGHDGGKIKGKKEAHLKDTEGFVLGCYVGAANENNKEGIISSIYIDNMTDKYEAIEKMWADMGYQDKDLKDKINQEYQQEYRIDLEIIKRPPKILQVHQDTPAELLPKLQEGFKV